MIALTSKAAASTKKASRASQRGSDEIATGLLPRIKAKAGEGGNRA
jgi:hypothetical protein